MADNGSAPAGDGDSRGGLLHVLRRLFEPGEGELSLREQLEGAIDEHEDGDAGPSTGGLAGDLSPIERQMLRNLLHFSEHDADDVAIPRGKIVALSADAAWDDVVAAFAEHGHSRMPVYRETLDDVIGMMHIKDIFPILAANAAPPARWTELMREPLFVPQSRGALDVLADMRARRTHLAIVVDEYSGTDGIVTFEDLVEEIVGEIEDEHDDAPEVLLAEAGEGAWEADARIELEELGERVDPRLGEFDEAVDTLGGLAFMLAGRVPEVGARLEHDSGWTIEVLAGDERHVTRLLLHPPTGSEDGLGDPR